MIILMCFPIILIIVLLILITRSGHGRGSRPDVQTSAGQQDSVVNDFSNAYQWKYLFTMNEKNEFRKLLVWANENDFYVFPKVRLLDIIEPRNNVKNYRALLQRIWSKHVDFVVCDRDFKIKFIIELDDNSHNRKDRVMRDEFVEQALRGAGYSVNHTKGISNEFLKSLQH